MSRRMLRLPTENPYPLEGSAAVPGTRARGTFTSEELVKQVLMRLAEKGFLRDDTDERREGILKTVSEVMTITDSEEEWKGFLS